MKKGNLDIELALDAYINKDQYDIFVLFSGDSDFMYLMNLLKICNKRIIVFSTRKQIAREVLKNFEFINMSNLRKYLER